MPSMMVRWSLSNSEAGWITSAFYAAYMVSVPVLVTLTERIDAKRVYLFGVGGTTMAHLAFGLLAEGFWSALALRALAGVSWAGTYMTGLHASECLVGLTEREREVLSRMAVGDSNKLIARRFDLSPHTVKRHVANILDKLGVDTRGQAAARWRESAEPGLPGR